MTEIIAIVNEKGGTGKTTTAVNLSAALGELGRKVLLVDLDGQAASSRWLGIEDDTRFADALWAGEAFEPIPEVMPCVCLAPGSGKLDSVAHDLRPTQGGQLRKVLSLLPSFDHVIIDCPPSLGNRLIGNALLAATHAIVPVEASILALDGLKILLTTFQDVRDGFGHDIILRGVLACRYDHRTRLSRLVLAELNRSLPGRVFHTVIRENIRMRECPGSGKSILDYAPDSHAAEDYRNLAKEMMAITAEVADPASAAGEALDNELSDVERQAILDIRSQVNAMFRASDSRPQAGDHPAPSAHPDDLAQTMEASESPAPADDLAVEESPQPFPAPLAEGPRTDETWAPNPRRQAEMPRGAEATQEAGPSLHIDTPLPFEAPRDAENSPDAEITIEPKPNDPAEFQEPAPAPVHAQADDPAPTGIASRRGESSVDSAWNAAGESAGAAPGQSRGPGASQPREPLSEDLADNAADLTEPTACESSANDSPAPMAEELPQEQSPAEDLSQEQLPAQGPAEELAQELAQERAGEPAEAPGADQADQADRADQQAESAEALEEADSRSADKDPADAGAALPSPPPAEKKDNMAALRLVLETITKQAQDEQTQHEAKKEPVWKRLFNKRSA